MCVLVTHGLFFKDRCEYVSTVWWAEARVIHCCCRCQCGAFLFLSFFWVRLLMFGFSVCLFVIIFICCSNFSLSFLCFAIALNLIGFHNLGHDEIAVIAYYYIHTDKFRAFSAAIGYLNVCVVQFAFLFLLHLNSWLIYSLFIYRRVHEPESLFVCILMRTTSATTTTAPTQMIYHHRLDTFKIMSNKPHIKCK